MPADAARHQRVDQAGQSRFARVEALRAVCCLGVVAAHVWGYSHDWNYELVYGEYWRRWMMALGQVGVPIFFAASGYLLYLPFARRDFGGGGKVDVRQYALNRARRIFPLYYVSLVVVLLFWTGGGSFQQWWTFLLFAQNFSTETEGTVNGVLWSLVVDLQFYLLLPFLAIALGRLARGRMRVAVGVVLASIAASCVAYALGPTFFEGLALRAWQHNLPACFSFLAAGMLLALVRVHFQQHPPTWTAGTLGRTDVWLAAAVAITALTVYRYDMHFLNAATAFLVLGATVLPLRSGVVIRLLDWRPLALLGVATFSIYMWHGPILRGLTDDAWMPQTFLGEFLVVTPIALAIGYVSYLVIERPFLSRRRTWSPAALATSPDVRLEPAAGQAPDAAPSVGRAPVSARP